MSKNVLYNSRYFHYWEKLKFDYNEYFGSKELEANQSQWISVNDAIPKDNAEGICKVKFVDDSIDEMTMRKVSKWVFPYTKGKYVTHWKPIAKPKEVKE